MAQSEARNERAATSKEIKPALTRHTNINYQCGNGAKRPAR
ncbi:hypothetical protein [Aeromonas salmonicida]